MEVNLILLLEHEGCKTDVTCQRLSALESDFAPDLWLIGDATLTDDTRLNFFASRGAASSVSTRW